MAGGGMIVTLHGVESFNDTAHLEIRLADPSGRTPSVRPARVRNRTKTDPTSKVKKPAEDSNKKPAPTRKAPARGRYVDEYARPAC